MGAPEDEGFALAARRVDQVVVEAKRVFLTIARDEDLLAVLAIHESSMAEGAIS